MRFCTACQPLLDQNIITADYPGYIINNVHEFGPYIVIAPEICIPHAQEGKGVNETAVAFMNVEEAVDFELVLNINLVYSLF